MKAFILALLLGKVILISPGPIDVAPTYTLKLEKPVSSITGRASLQIDVSSHIPPSLDPFQAKDLALKEFPKGSISASLSQSSSPTSAPIKMAFQGSVIRTKDKLLLLLQTSTDIPINRKFDIVRVYSKEPLRSVRIYWKNIGEK